LKCAREARGNLDKRKSGRYAGRVRLAVVGNRNADSLCGFVESTVAPGSLIVTDDWRSYVGLESEDRHLSVPESGIPDWPRSTSIGSPGLST